MTSTLTSTRPPAVHYIVQFDTYTAADRAACLAIFDANCPAFFHAGERGDYEAFLDAQERTERGYLVCYDPHASVLGAFGLLDTPRPRVARINWILISPAAQGRGIGAMMVQHAITRARDRGIHTILIATSDKSAGFFTRFGARAVTHTPDGWGPGLHRVDMELTLAPRQG